jgi:hypothetical protein
MKKLSPGVFTKLGFLSLVILGSGRASAIVDISKTHSLPVDRLNEIADEKTRTAVEIFVTNLSVYHDLDASKNDRYWRTKFRVSDKKAASVVENDDIVQLNKKVDDQLTIIGGSTHKALKDAFDAKISREPEAENHLDTPSAFPAIDALDTTISTAFGNMNKEQWIAYRNDLFQAFSSGGMPIPTLDFQPEDAPIYVQQAKKVDEAYLTVHLLKGLSVEEVKLFNIYRNLYPEFNFVKLDGNAKVKMSLDTTSQGVSADQANEKLPATFAAIDMFHAGSVDLPSDDTNITFKMTHSGNKAITKKVEGASHWNLPVKFNQTLNIPYTLSGTVRCRLNASMLGELSFTSTKYANGEKFIPNNVITPELRDDPNNFCNLDVVDFDKKPALGQAEFIAALNAKQDEFKQEFGLKRDASIRLRDEMFAEMLDASEAQFNRHVPEEWRSRLITSYTTECRTHVTKVCGGDFFGGCWSKAVRTHRHCEDVARTVRNYYKVTTPLIQVNRRFLSDNISVNKDYPLTKEMALKWESPLADGLCVQFLGKNSTDFASSCDTKAVEESKDDKRLEDSEKQPNPEDSLGVTVVNY